MTVVHLTAKAPGKKRTIVSIETYGPAAPLEPKAKSDKKANTAAMAKVSSKAKATPKAAKGNKNSK
jgi:hypothetical protein